MMAADFGPVERRKSQEPEGGHQRQKSYQEEGERKIIDCQHSWAGDERQEGIVAPEKAPGRAGIAPKHELEETFDDNFLAPVAEEMEHDLLGGLVKGNHHQGDKGNSAIRGPQHGRFGCHCRNQWGVI